MITVIVGLITIAALIHYYYLNVYNYWKKRGIPYYLKNSVYLESFRLFNKNFMDDAIEQYTAFPDKRAYGVFTFGQPQLMIRDPDLLREICVKDFEHFTNHQDVFFRNDEMLGKNLFALKDKKWRDMRTILSPVFTGSKLRGLCELMSECGSQTVTYYAQKIKQQNNNNPLKVDIFDACTRFTNDVIASTAFGIKVNSLTDKNNEFFGVGQQVSSFSSWRLWLFNLPLFVKQAFNIKIFPEDVYKFFRQIVNETIRVRVEKNIIRHDMIHLLMEARKEQIKRTEASNGKVDNISATNNVLTNDDITAQGVIFFIAGFSNVALAISMASYEMAVNPEIQKKAYAEITEVLKANNGKIDYDVIKQMKYLEMIISETLRKWSPVVVGDRVCNKAFKIETPNDGVINVEPGMTMSIPISGLHNDPKYFPNPKKFDPERFNEKNKSKMNPYTYIPFGLGPRICIANRFVLIETKILLFHILKTFEIVTTDETPIPMVLEKGAVIKPKGDTYGLAFKIRQ